MDSKTAVKRANKVAAKITVAPASHAVKVRRTPHFYRPKTATYGRNPRVPSSIIESGAALEGKANTVISSALVSESAIAKLDKNTIVFLCDVKATKSDIKRAVEKMYNVKVLTVNTLVRPDCKKKAFVKLASENSDATKLAQSIGVVV